MQLWLLDHVATSLDSSIILELQIIKKNCFLIEDQWRNFDVDVLKVSSALSNQLFSYHFTHSSTDGMTSVRFIFMLIFQI